MNELYFRGENKDKIICLGNKKPEWSEEKGGFMLNFRGRAKKASIKNFIIEDPNAEEENKEVMIFGKLAEDDYRMDLKYPLSPFVALGITLSTFGSKIGCE